MILRVLRPASLGRSNLVSEPKDFFAAWGSRAGTDTNAALTNLWSQKMFTLSTTKALGVQPFEEVPDMSKMTWSCRCAKGTQISVAEIERMPAKGTVKWLTQKAE